jgi:hypothetical protein
MNRKYFITTLAKSSLLGLPVPKTLAGFISGTTPPPSSGKEIAPLIRGKEDFSCMWWGEGVRSPEKVFYIQSPFYGLSFDFSSLRVCRLGIPEKSFGEEEVLHQGNESIDRLPEVSIHACIESRGTTYSFSSSGNIEDCELIESGPYFQRRWMPGLKVPFEGFDADPLQSGIEICAWPDRIHVSVRFLPVSDMESTVACIRFDGHGNYRPERYPDGRIAWTNEKGEGFVLQPFDAGTLLTIGDGAILAKTACRKMEAGKPIVAGVVIIPGKRQGHQRMTTPDPEGRIHVEARQVAPVERTLDVAYDASCGWHAIHLPDDVTAGDLIDSHHTPGQCAIAIHNPSGTGQTVRLAFCKGAHSTGHTGICTVICDKNDIPQPVPVQISKDWHDRPDRFNGVWYRGIVPLHVPAGSTLAFDAYTIHSYWKGVPAATMSQLCLAGWGKNQLWLQSAIGCWGESITFEPDQTHGRGLVLDSRPLAVWGMGDQPVKWSWTHNVGGADFLVWFDNENRKKWIGRSKTVITKYGPVLAEAKNCSLTDDGAVSLRYKLNVYGTDDYVRGIYRFRIQILKDIGFSRFVVFQCGSDNYNYSAERKLAAGNAGGLLKEWDARWGGDTYRTPAMPLPGPTPWIAMSGAVNLNKTGGAIADRGIIIREWRAVIQGQPVAPCAAERGARVTGNDTSQIDILLPQSYSRLYAGDMIEGVIEHVIMPRSAGDYFGHNERLSAALAASGDTWKMIHREAALNDPVVDVTGGQVLSLWPVTLRYLGSPFAFSIRRGLGYIPVTITGAPAGVESRLEEYVDGKWIRAGSRQGETLALQKEADPGSGLINLTFSLFMDAAHDMEIKRSFRIDQ